MDASNVDVALAAVAKALDVDPYDFQAEMDYHLSKPTTVQVELVTVEYIDGETGGEDFFAGGEGEIYHLIKVTTGDNIQYFKKTGMYYSFAGSEWNDDWVEVFPKKKTITVYE